MPDVDRFVPAIAILGSLMAINLVWGLYDSAKGRPFDVYSLPERSRLVRGVRGALFLAVIPVGFDYWIIGWLPLSALPAVFYAFMLFENVVSVVHRVMTRGRPEPE